MPIRVGQKINRRLSGTLEERFWPKVEKTEGCWIWRGARLPKGYGVLGRGRRGEGWVSAHRLSWELANGSIPVGMVVMHACDNPPCVRPDHLRLGTLTENNRDMALKGRWRNQFGGAADDRDEAPPNPS